VSPCQTGRFILVIDRSLSFFDVGFDTERGNTVTHPGVLRSNTRRKLNLSGTRRGTAKHRETTESPSSKRLLGQLPGRGWVRLPCTSATIFKSKQHGCSDRLATLTVSSAPSIGSIFRFAAKSAAKSRAFLWGRLVEPAFLRGGPQRCTPTA
jgi:hypothetical protein